MKYYYCNVILNGRTFCYLRVPVNIQETIVINYNRKFDKSLPFNKRRCN